MTQVFHGQFFFLITKTNVYKQILLFQSCFFLNIYGRKENRNVDTLTVIRLSEKERLFKIVYFYIF